MKVRICKNDFNHVVNVVLDVTKAQLVNASPNAKVLRDSKDQVVFRMEYGKEPSVTEVGMVAPAASFSIVMDGHSEEAINATKMKFAKIACHVNAVEKQIKKEATALEKAAAEIEVC